MGGVPVDEETVVVVIEPIRLPSEEDLWIQSPHIVPFYLLSAKALRDEAEPKRLESITETVRTPDATLRPAKSDVAFDALRGLAMTAILSAGAIEAYANDVIDGLPEDAMVELPKRLAGKTVAVMHSKAELDWLRIEEKLARVLPALSGRKSIKGTQAWQDFRRINRLRNDLLHVRRLILNDPAKPGPFGKLMLGEASTAPEDAAAIIEALNPGWIPQGIRAEFGLSG
jgi:hypothetical protein